MSAETGQAADTELIRSSATGDRAAFDELVVRHQAAVFRFTRTVASDSTAAEDALQETFLAAWRGAKGFRGESSVRGWLLAIARHAVNRQVRRRVGEPRDFASLDELAEHAGWGDPEQVAVQNQTRERLQDALESLSSEDREVLLLRELEGLTGEETASLLQISMEAMKSRLHRARLRLAARLMKVPA